MEPLQQQTWTLPENFPISGLRDALFKTFAIKPGATTRFTRSWYDTFDWRLYQQKQLLVKQGTKWILQDFRGCLVEELTGQRKKNRFLWDFPDSSLKEELSKSIDIRSLLELGREDVRVEELKIVNNDKKIVAFVSLQESIVRNSGEKLAMVSLREVRGYGKRFHQVASHLLSTGVSESSSPANILSMILAGTGRHPLDYSSGYNVPLEPNMRAIDALKEIYSYLGEQIRKNEQGVIDDIDSEFLHDLRVAVRRTRSGLALIREVLAPEIVERFKEDFSYIGQITGPVRDLDVYLLSESDYKSRLPERLQIGMDYFFQDLSARRKVEQRKLVSGLRSNRYQQILNNWQDIFAGEKEIPTDKNGAMPIKDVANKIIYKRFRRVLHDGSNIHRGTPDEDLHRLRIQGKKLRYCLEFFSPVYDRDTMKGLIKQLKVLQNNLGDFNDLSVQQDMLAEYLSQLKSATIKARELAASTGGLMTDLSRRHHEVRIQFERAFAHFSEKKNIDVYQELFR
jgi:CHAD domain-containing protein